jgi:hypothetical protein
MQAEALLLIYSLNTFQKAKKSPVRGQQSSHSHVAGRWTFKFYPHPDRPFKEYV